MVFKSKLLGCTVDTLDYTMGQCIMIVYLALLLLTLFKVMCVFIAAAGVHVKLEWLVPLLDTSIINMRPTICPSNVYLIPGQLKLLHSLILNSQHLVKEASRIAYSAYAEFNSIMVNSVCLLAKLALTISYQDDSQSQATYVYFPMLIPDFTALVYYEVYSQNRKWH